MTTELQVTTASIKHTEGWIDSLKPARDPKSLEETALKNYDFEEKLYAICQELKKVMPKGNKNVRRKRQDDRGEKI